MRTVRVNASKAYDVIIGTGLLEGIGKYIKKPRKVAVIADTNTGRLYGSRVIKSLTDCGLEAGKFEFQAGERNKNLSTYGRILDYLALSKLDRTDAVLALGGGVTGDMAGFAAATYMRGTGYIQVPTSLLAAVDSSVGGKTAVDLEAGKNLAGAFYQPDIVICDIETLDTLPEREKRSGMGEVIKYGMLAEAGLLDQVPQTSDRESMERLIETCVSIKRDIVQQDEFESGCRKLLNFGHTIGHAVEKVSGYSLLHGEAVAIGMVSMTKAALRMGLCSEETLEILTKTVSCAGLPVSAEYDKDALFDAIKSDKKAAGDGIDIVLPEGIGKCRIQRISFSDMYELL
ncbi:MAG: 3-dehydroquinate synthase [Bacillota bacterium]|nr:3-dehydroquinate synthase [Bacillota bacterium]